MESWFDIMMHWVLTKNFDLDKEKTQEIQKILEKNDLTEKEFKIENIT